MSRKLSGEELIRWRSYHVTGCGNHTTRKINCLFINTSNTIEHERGKLELMYEIMKSGGVIITEAVRNKVDYNGKNRRIDLVDLSTGVEYEVVHKHETDLQVKEYRDNGIHVKVINPITCKICGKVYPRRNKTDICQLCKVR
jgi:hypothetical protein